jgi:hypothetical protein
VIIEPEEVQEIPEPNRGKREPEPGARRGPGKIIFPGKAEAVSPRRDLREGRFLKYHFPEFTSF